MGKYWVARLPTEWVALAHDAVGRQSRGSISETDLIRL